MSKLKIGFVGAGGIAQQHLSLMGRFAEEAELAGIVDVNLEAAKAAAQTYGAPFSGQTLDELLPLVDAVLVCVPTFLHADLVSQALRAGKPVFCEKPLARTLDQANAMLAAQEESGSPLQVGFVRRFDAEWLSFCDAVQESRIGRPVVWRDISAGYGPLAPWFNQDELGGGPFLDGCIHNIDFALKMFGPASWVFTHGRTMRPGSTAIDTGSATIRFQSGDELLLAWSWGLPQRCSTGSQFDILGPAGCITWPGSGLQEGERFVIQTEQGARPVAFEGYPLGQAFQDQLGEFIAVARGRVSPRAGAAEGLASLKVALGLLQSARTEAVVHLS